MPESSMHFLGFDFGMRRIGVAVGQKLTCTASPLAVIKATDGVPNWQQLDPIIEKWQPTGIVLGIPLNMDGTTQEMTFCARKFGKRLYKRYQIPIFETDERLSTFEAKQRLLTDDVLKSFRKRSRQDDIAAQVILEAWFEEN